MAFGLTSFDQRCQQQVADMHRYPNSQRAVLADMPVYNTGHRLEGQLFQMVTQDQPVILVAIRHELDHGTWIMATVASEHPMMPVGGYQLSIAEEEVQRYPKVTMTWDANGVLHTDVQDQPLWSPETSKTTYPAVN